MKTLKFEIDEGSYLDLSDAIESAADELEMLSKEVDWYVTDLPELLRTRLAVLDQGEK